MVKEVFMIYLKSFKLLSAYEEHSILNSEERRIFNRSYPLHIFSSKEFENIDFDDITIFYGGNGSGKTTLINIISEKLNSIRKSNIDKGAYFDYYVEMCQYYMSRDPIAIKTIISDDVFDSLLDIRSINMHVNRKKEALSKEYLNNKYNKDHISFSDYDNLKKDFASKTKSLSQYVRERLGNNNIIEQSNGESALLFWEREITENGIYILDEPENSLSAENQLKLKKYIEDSVRFYNCQFIISTHSPFLLNLHSAKIYDLDSVPVDVKKWTQLPNVRLYYNFFKEKDEDFKNNNSN